MSQSTGRSVSVSMRGEEEIVYWQAPRLKWLIMYPVGVDVIFSVELYSDIIDIGETKIAKAY